MENNYKRIYGTINKMMPHEFLLGVKKKGINFLCIKDALIYCFRLCRAFLK